MSTKEAKDSTPRSRRWLHRLRVAGILASDRALAFSLLIAACLVRLNDPYPVELARLKVFDYYQLTKPRALIQRPVTIVDLDEESMATVGQWPWPRTVIAELVSRLARAGAVVVGFDMAFPEPDRMSPERIAESVGGLDGEIASRLRRMPSSDTVLAQTLKRSRTVLGQFAYEREVAAANKTPPPTVPMAEIGEDPRGFLPIHLGMVRNFAKLEQAATGNGMVTLLPESDGVVRRVPAVVRVGDRIFPSLSIEMLRVATGQGAYAIRTGKGGLTELVLAGQRIPTDSRGRIWVYFSASNPARYISAGKILGGKEMPAGLVPRIAGKLILIGTSAIGLRDLRPTPIDARLPGVEVHANLIETILGHQHLKRPAEATTLEILATFTAGLIIIVLVPLVGPIWTFPLFLGIAATLAGSSYYLFADHRLMADATFPILSTFLIYILLTYANYSREAAEKRRVRNAFRHYMSPALVEQLARNPDRLRLGGETRDMTLLFCDVRSFTSICEGLDAAGVTRMLNRFLTPMTDIVLSHDGTIDKYMGDAIMAFWNAPLDVADHAVEACRAAFEMLTRLRELNDELKAEADAEGRKQIPLQVGIGINTGPCMVGNMGSEQRFDYSVLGDDVNLASRLEGLSKVYGVPIIVSEATIGLAATFDSLELDVVRVKGKVRPVRIYALFSERMLSAIPDFWDLSGTHDRMLNAYRGQNWTAAKRYLVRCRQLSTGSAVSKLYDLYAERLSAYEAAPPGVDWDGVHVATSK